MHATSGGEGFEDRRDAGRRLALLLGGEGALGESPVVLALPRGGVPVGYELARALGAPLDVLVVRKLGVPGQRELAMGAIAAGGVRVLNDEVIALLGISDEELDEATIAERTELERRERAYRGDRPAVRVAGRHAIIVDDGLATGATMRAAVAALRTLGPSRITVAVPVGAEEAVRALGTLADDVVSAIVPRRFRAVGEWYRDFSETSDDEVRALLASTAVEDPREQVVTERSITSSLDAAIAIVRASALPLVGDDRDFEALAPLVDGARVVLIGDGTHGTHDFYLERARITRWLLDEKGFTDVAVEADWPDTWRLNRFLRGDPGDDDAVAALGDFERFPRWMWRNAVVRDFATWLRVENDARAPNDRVGFFGLDLYSLHRSMDAVIAYLDRQDPAAAARARSRYGCFDAFGDEPQLYGFATERRGAATCEADVAAQLEELRAEVPIPIGDGPFAEDDRFFAVQNARLARNAESYYRAMFRSSVASWNLRDRHMAETLEELARHLEARRGRPARIAVWAHNSHLGDARATHMGWLGELNLGQLVRQRYGDRALSIGMTTHRGTVAAASDWGEDVERKLVRPALSESFEWLFKEAELARHLLVLRGGGELTQALRPTRLERAIGVIYRPETERQSHYFAARLADQFDAVIHVDESRALDPLDRVAGWESDDAPETYPTGM